MDNFKAYCQLVSADSITATACHGGEMLFTNRRDGADKLFAVRIGAADQRRLRDFLNEALGETPEPAMTPQERAVIDAALAYTRELRRGRCGYPGRRLTELQEAALNLCSPVPKADRWADAAMDAG